MSLITSGSFHEGHEWFSNDSQGRRDFHVFGCSIMCAILPISEWRFQDIDQILLLIMRSFFLFHCIQQQGSARLNCSLLVLGEKSGNCEANLL